MTTHTLAVGDTSLAVWTVGSGMPLLLLHAFPLDHSMWEWQEPLAEHLRLIVPDQRGFGGSGAGRDGPAPEAAVPRSTAVPRSIEQLADDAAALLDALHVAEPAVICGVSMGGYVAQHMAVRHPGRVRALVLVDTRLEADTPEARAGRLDLASRVARVGRSILADAMIPRMLAAAAPAADPHRNAVAAALERMITSQPVPTITAALAALAARPDMMGPMAGVRVPTLLVVGEEDVITPVACMERAEEVIPGARLLIVPRAGHLVPMERPELFNAAVLEFLRESVHRS